MHCDRLFFATTLDVPCEIFPKDTGLIVADALRRARSSARRPSTGCTAPTRKSMMLRIARAAALRLQSLIDPTGPYAASCREERHADATGWLGAMLVAAGRCGRPARNPRRAVRRQDRVA